MTGASRIVSIEGTTSDTVVEPPLNDSIEIEPSQELADEFFDDVEDSKAGGSGWIAPLLAAAAIMAWSGFFVWADLATITAATPAQAVQLIGWWSIPVLVIAVSLLVVLRTSRREAMRFADSARSLAMESERLERRLSAVNTELSLARDFLAAQGRDLDALGRISVERISGSASQLETLIGDNGKKLDRIADVSSNALENMEKLRGQLPVIANAAKDVTNNIANAGRTAHLQIEDMVGGFQRLNEFGVASERQVQDIRDKVDAALAAFAEAASLIGQISSDRFTALARDTQAHREQLDQEEIAALAAIRARAEALGAELAQQAAAVAAAEEQALAGLHTRFLALRDECNGFAETVSSTEQAALDSWRTRAQSQVDGLRTALTDIGNDHDGIVEDARARLAGFEHGAQSLMARVGEAARQLDEEMMRRRTAVEAGAIAHGEALTQRLIEIDRMVGERRSAMASAGAEAADALARKLAELDQVVEEQRQRQVEDINTLAGHCEAIGTRMAAFSQALAASGDVSGQTAQAVSEALGLLGGRLSETRNALAGTDQQIAGLTDSAVRLLELIQAGSEHTRTQIPEALRSTEAGLGKIEDRIFALRDSLREAGDNGRLLSQSMEATHGTMTETASAMIALQDDFAKRTAEQEAGLSALRTVLADARAESDALSQGIEARLADSVTQLTQAARNASVTLNEDNAREIEQLAARLGDEANAAIARVLQGRGAELVARLEEAIDSAAEASRETAIQMRDQLTKVDELAGNLENRVMRVRERAEEQIDSDFARRAALITESLNSTAIDIAKALSSDVSETAWASYLRGDRGIFTRRAVSLLDSAEVKAVQQHYESEAEFREHVNRYIHDFESMLRQLLSTRDGNALGVTLLSSDMGKLYVALAQGIERLRS